jgi:DNA repair protein SbcC/Rad50
MIKSISLQNFQSHSDSTLLFNPNVNVILGASDSGKTAILRAIRKLAFNKPSGDEMKSHWGGKLQIEMFTDDAHVVYSKDKEAEYILNGGKPLKAFSTTVPDEIEKALNLSEINIQSQLDNVFLLSETPGFVASHFNKIAHLEVIDKATSNINSAIRELTSDIKYSEGQEKTLQEGLQKFQYLENFESEVEILEEQEKQLKQLCNLKEKLENIITLYWENTGSIIEYKETLELEKPINDILELIELRAKKDVEVVKLDKLIVQIEEIQSIIEKQNALLLVEKPVNDLLGLYKEKETLVNEQKRLFKALESVQGVQVRLKFAKVGYDNLYTSFEKNMGNVCILCGQNIKNLD